MSAASRAASARWRRRKLEENAEEFRAKEALRVKNYRAQRKKDRHLQTHGLEGGLEDRDSGAVRDEEAEFSDDVDAWLYNAVAGSSQSRSRAGYDSDSDSDSDVSLPFSSSSTTRPVSPSQPQSQSQSNHNSEKNNPHKQQDDDDVTLPTGTGTGIGTGAGAPSTSTSTSKTARVTFQDARDYVADAQKTLQEWYSRWGGDFSQRAGDAFRSLSIDPGRSASRPGAVDADADAEEEEGAAKAEAERRARGLEEMREILDMVRRAREALLRLESIAFIDLPAIQADPALAEEFRGLWHETIRVVVGLNERIAQADTAFQLSLHSPCFAG